MPQVLETREALEKKFATIFYYPIDATPKAEWITDCVSLIDFPVAYTNYAKAETLKIDANLDDTRVIYHGTNLTDFNYIEDRQTVAEFRKRYFGGHADGKFLLTNINRNQPRKDILRSFLVLQELKRRGRDNLHMSHSDAGGNLLVMADHFGFKLNEDFILPSPKVFQVNQGIPIEMVNLIYNASDAVISTTLGEGWGLSITEAMATRTPIIAPDNTSLHEMMAESRGVLVPSGDTPGAWFTLGAQDNERIRPLMNVERAADAVEGVMDGQLPDIEGAYTWARESNWDNICKYWIEVFAAAAEHSRQLTEIANHPPLNREQRRKLKKENRNASIPI
jgi:glycosyltransferase involved in cell wall biosynthesis